MDSLDIVMKAVSWVGDMFHILEQVSYDLQGRPKWVEKGQLSIYQKEDLAKIEDSFNTSRHSIETGFWRLQKFIRDEEEEFSIDCAGDQLRRAKIERETKEADDKMYSLYPEMKARLENMQRMFDGKSYVHY